MPLRDETDPQFLMLRLDRPGKQAEVFGRRGFGRHGGRVPRFGRSEWLVPEGKVLNRLPAKDDAAFDDLQGEIFDGRRSFAG